MKQVLLCCLLVCLGGFAMAQTVLGSWKTIDDNTGAERSYVEIYEKDGLVYGKITKLLDEDPPSLVCTECKDYRKNQPLVGMEIITALKPNGTNWKGGKIMDPENGKSYNCKIWLDSDDVLKVRGFVGPLYRTQTWYRLN